MVIDLLSSFPFSAKHAHGLHALNVVVHTREHTQRREAYVREYPRGITREDNAGVNSRAYTSVFPLRLNIAQTLFHTSLLFYIAKNIKVENSFISSPDASFSSSTFFRVEN